jgi:copper(I)-binding protein
VSRAEHHTTTRRRVLAGIVPSVLGVGLAAVLAGCGSGQITQTDTQLSGVNGASATVGSMAIRDAQLAYPADQQGVYQPGSSARLVVTIVNTGLTSDTLVKVTSPGVASITIDGSADGTKLIPGNFSVASGQDEDDSTAGPSSAAVPTTSVPVVTTTTQAPPSSGQPNSGQPSSPASGSLVPSAPPTTTASAVPTAPGVVKIELVGIKSLNGAPLRAGLTIPMTFYFQHAGQVTLAQVPIGAPADS